MCRTGLVAHGAPATGLLTRTHAAQVCVFYLVLRGLDTVEDDMSLAQVSERSGDAWCGEGLK